ncbi:deaminase [Humibacter sp. BT305]|nr:deaminase [Humibacter sp. BT305]
MRPLRYSINVTLDGCVDHREALADPSLHRHAAEALARADALIFGRRIYTLMEDAWRSPLPPSMPDWMHPFAETIDVAKKYVVSTTLEAPDWNADLLRGGDGLEDEIRALKAQPGEGLYTGGVTLPTALARLDLIDEYEFIVHPRVAGHGPYLFGGLPSPIELTAIGETRLGSGAVATRYIPTR